MNEFYFYLVTMFISFVYIFVVQFSFDISRGSLAPVILFLDKFVGDFLEYESPDTMSIFVCNVLIVEINR